MSYDIPVATAVSYDVSVGVTYPTGGEYFGTEMKHFLEGRGWPNGLQDLAVKAVHKMPIRYVICDDSGSMMTSDGVRKDKGPDRTSK